MDWVFGQVYSISEAPNQSQCKLVNVTLLFSFSFQNSTPTRYSRHSSVDQAGDSSSPAAAAGDSPVRVEDSPGDSPFSSVDIKDLIRTLCFSNLSMLSSMYLILMNTDVIAPLNA